MSTFMWFLITLVIGIAGGLFLQKLKFPAGALVGALIAVGIFSILSDHAVMPSSLKTITKAISGLFIGMNMNMEMVRNMKRLIKPMAAMVAFYIVVCFGVGIIIHYSTGIDPITALFSVAPGGMVDMTLMTLDMNGDAAVVAVLQTLRLLTAFCISMPLVKLLAKRFQHTEHTNTAHLAPKRTLSADEKRHGIVWATCVTIIGGAIGFGLSKVFDFSVLVLISAMIVSAAVNIKTGKLYMPKYVRRAAQLLSGALIGTTVTHQSLVHLRAVLVPAIFICLLFISLNIIIAVLLHKFCHMDMATAMLSSAAGGASELALTAADFDADPTAVSVLQISRLVFTTVFYPILVKLILPLL